MTVQTRPTGITVLAVLAAIGGVLGIFGGLTVTLLGSALATVTGGFGALIGLIGIVALVVGIAELVLAYGFWYLKPWAWMLGVGIAAVNIVVAVLYILAGGSIVSQVISIVISGAILYYLWQPAIKAVFGQK